MTKGVYTLPRKSFLFLFTPVSLLAVILLLNGWPAPAQTSISAAAIPAPRLRHELQVDDPALPAQIIAQGGRLIAYYCGCQCDEAAALPASRASHCHGR